MVRDDEIDWPKLWHSNVRRLRALARRYGLDDDDVDDVLANAILYVYSNRKRARSVEAYLTLKVRHEAINRVKWLARHATAVRTMAGEEAADAGPMVNELDERDRLTERDLDELMRRNLDEREQLVVRLHFIDGRKHVDIAEQLGISAELSRQILARARATLRPLVRALLAGKQATQ